MAEHLNQEEEDLLQSALSSAFSPAPVRRVSVALDPKVVKSLVQEPDVESAAAGEPAPAAAAGEEDAWKAEYEGHVARWREQSTEQREKAEEERAKWEAIRAKEREEGKTRGEEWEKVHVGASAAGSSGAGNVSGQAERRESADSADSLKTVLPSGNDEPHGEPSAHEKEVSEHASSGHDKWEDVPSSLTSSYPSMSFPSDPHSPTSSHSVHHLARPGGSHAHAHDHGPHRHAHADGTHKHAPQDTATFAVFDSSLSRKTRALALLSSLAINLLLPFVNGVMLGFGEIFARNVVVGWFGWKAPGSVAANVGLGSRRGDRRNA